jgi:hypothetical protein
MGAAVDMAALQPGRVVVEVGLGVVVYPPEAPGGSWRAVFTENGQRRYRQAPTEAALAAKLDKVLERLAAGAVNTERTGADLIAHYLDPDRLPADRRWSRKHAHTQQRLCERFAPSSPPWPARTSPPPTCSRSSTRPPPPARAPAPPA